MGQARQRCLSGLAAFEAQEAVVEFVRRHRTAFQPGDLIHDRQAGGVQRRAEQQEDDAHGQEGGPDVGALQRAHPVALAPEGAEGSPAVAGGIGDTDEGAGGGDDPVRGQAILADAQRQAEDGEHDQRGKQDCGDPHGEAQHQRRQVVGAAVLIGGVDEDDQGGGCGEHQGGGIAGLPQGLKTGEGQGGEEAGGQHRHDQQQP